MHICLLLLLFVLLLLLLSGDTYWKTLLGYALSPHATAGSEARESSGNSAGRWSGTLLHTSGPTLHDVLCGPSSCRRASGRAALARCGGGSGAGRRWQSKSSRPARSAPGSVRPRSTRPSCSDTRTSWASSPLTTKVRRQDFWKLAHPEGTPR